MSSDLRLSTSSSIFSVGKKPFQAKRDARNALEETPSKPKFNAAEGPFKVTDAVRVSLSSADGPSRIKPAPKIEGEATAEANVRRRAPRPVAGELQSAQAEANVYPRRVPETPPENRADALVNTRDPEQPKKKEPSVSIEALVRGS